MVGSEKAQTPRPLVFDFQAVFDTDPLDRIATPFCILPGRNDPAGIRERIGGDEDTAGSVAHLLPIDDKSRQAQGMIHMQMAQKQVWLREDIVAPPASVQGEALPRQCKQRLLERTPAAKDLEVQSRKIESVHGLPPNRAYSRCSTRA